jgi:hypothetical protein
MWKKRFKGLAAGLGGAADDIGAAGDQSPRPMSTSARQIARTAVKKLLYSEAALRLFGHMILAVAVKA